MKSVGLISILLLVIIAGAFALFVTFLQDKELPRQVIIVAENMSFSSSAQNIEGELNPTFTFHVGEKISILFQNKDAGIRHDLVIEGLDIQTAVLSYGEFERFTISVPDKKGTYTYYCTFHKLMMIGQIVIE